MSRISWLWLYILLLLSPVQIYAAATDAARIAGDLKVDGIHFSADGSVMTKLSDAPQGPKGDQGIQGIQGPKGYQGIQGLPGPSVSTQWLLKKQAYTKFVPVIGSAAAYTQTGMLEILYDTTGKSTGWIQTSQNGQLSSNALNPINTHVAYFTNHDTHNNPLSGYIVNFKSNGTMYPTANFIQSYTYNANGKKTQRVRTVYDSATNNIIQTETTNYDVNHHGATTSQITVDGTVTTTTTYTYSPFDPNGFPAIATTATTRVDSSTSSTTNYTGSELFEHTQFIPTTASGTAPYINATILSFPGTGTSPMGWTSQVQVYSDSNRQTPVTNATVTVNGTPLSYDAARTNYTGSPVIPLGAKVTLNITIGSTTYTATGTQYASFPTITAPTSGTTWNRANSNNITWTGGAPTAGAGYIAGLLNTATGNFGYPIPTGNGGGPADVAITTTSLTIPANSGIAAGSYLAIVGIGTPGLGSEPSGTGILIPGSSTGSGLWIGAVTGNTVTVH